MAKQFTFSLVITLMISFQSFAQKNYTASSGESIFSYGMVDADSTDIKPVVRWSPVFNFQQRIHFDFSKNVGIYTGVGLRNVGLISKVTYTNVLSVTKDVVIKERSYSLGLPVALKIGDLENRSYFAIGGEAELMFAYKRKIIDNGTKLRFNKWFDDNVNLFNPSVFAEYHFHKGQYIRFKYYLLDFLNYKGITLIDGTNLPDYGPRSPLFYVSVGSENLHRDLGKKTPSPETPDNKSAYFRSKGKNRSNENFTVTVIK